MRWFFYAYSHSISKLNGHEYAEIAYTDEDGNCLIDYAQSMGLIDNEAVSYLNYKGMSTIRGYRRCYK